MNRIWIVFLFLSFPLNVMSQELEIGISYYNKGDYDRCIKKMKEVLKEKEDSTAFRYLALCSIKAKMCGSAIPYIEKWKKLKKEEASYYGGVCWMDMGDDKKAISEFKEALNAPYPLKDYAMLFLGGLYLKIGDEKLGRYYLKIAEKGKSREVRERAGFLLKKKRGFTYKIDFASGWNYDSNAGLLPDDPNLRALFTRYFERKFDNRWFGNFKGSISLKPFNGFYSTLSYDFYQNLNQRLHHINFQTHRAQIEAGYLKKNLKPFISGGYSGAFISTDLNSFSEGGYGKTGLSYRIDSLEFGGSIYISKTAYYERLPQEQKRSGWFEGMEFYSQQTLSSRFNLYEGYSIENSNTRGSDWDYISHRLSLKGMLEPFKNFAVHIEPSYTYRDFRHKDSIFGKRRIDNEIGIEVLLGYEILKWLNLFASYAFYLDNSNMEMYNYKRSAVGAGIGVRVE